MIGYLLDYDSKTDTISLVNGAENFVCFKKLREADKTVKKLTFNSQLKVLYFLYDERSSLHEKYTPRQRKELIYKQLISYKKDRIETPEYKACENVIIRHTYTREEAQLHQLLKDFDNFIEYLNKIPWEREVTETTTEGKKVKEKTWMKSNMEERMKAVKSAKDLFILQKEYEIIVKGQRRSAEQTNTTVRMFEDPGYLDNINMNDRQN